MNTPSHAILNLALLLPDPQALPIIVLGAVLPDVPMFVLYAWAKIRRIPARQLWTETYHQPFWQAWTDLFHSIPLAIVGVGVGTLCQSPTLALLFGSAVLHSLLDLPVHHDDAHRHFFPFHNYRFISPLSYWDPRHHGYAVALVEILLVLIATLYLLPVVDSVFVKAIFVTVNVLYIGAYALMFARRQLPNLFCQAALKRD